MDDEKQQEISTVPPKGIHSVNWKRRLSNIISYLNINPRPKRKPRIIRLYGYKNFRLGPDKKTLIVFGREVLVDDKKIQKILEEAEQGYGGVKKTHARIQRKYLGNSHNDVANFFARSERRQLKAPKQGRGANRAFLHASRPGTLECDCTFYHGSKMVVFGMVDVFSRWCYYQVIKAKQPIDTGEALLVGLERFAKFGHKLLEVRTDSGNEFLYDSRNKGLKNPKPDFRSILDDIKKKQFLKITHRKQPMRMIESLNGILRRFVQRVDFETKADLAKLVEKFVKQWNDSPTKPLGGKTPNEVISIRGKEALKNEAERQFAVKLKKVSTTKFKLKELKKGSLVRISLLADKEELGHHGEKPSWTKQIYVVTEIVKSSRGPLRYRVREDHGKKVLGPYFRDRLLAVVRPTHSIGQKPKYQPGARKKGDVEREQAALRPDRVSKIAWTNKQRYLDAQDVREDSQEEYVPEKKVVVKRKKRKPRAIKVKKKMRMIGRSVYVTWDDGKTEDPHKAVIIEKYKSDWIVYFPFDKSVAGFLPKEIVRVTDDNPKSDAYVAKIKKVHKELIASVKQETDEANA